MLILDRRKPFFPGIHTGAYPLGLIGAYTFGETGSGSPGAGALSFYDSLSMQRIAYVFGGNAINLKSAVMNGGGVVNYNNSAGGYVLNDSNKTTRTYEPKGWFFRAGIQAATTATLASKCDNNTVSAGWIFAISATAGLSWVIEYTSVNLKVDVATGGVGPWAEAIHSFGIAWDGTVTSANQRIMIDGKLQAHLGGSTNGSGTHTVDDANPLAVTAVKNGPTFGGSNGIMESMFLFNRALTTAELQELYINPYRYYTPAMDVMLKSGANQFTQALNASMATFSGSLTRQTNKNLTASMSTFSAILGLAHHLFLVALPATMLQMAGALTKQAGKALNASMSTFAAVLSVVKIKSGNALTFNASMSTFAGSLTRQDNKVFNASMSRFSATLALAVRHEVPPPTCVPAATCATSTIISHVEQCDEKGS